MLSSFTALEFTKTSVPIQVQYSLQEATKKSEIQICEFLSIFQDFAVEHEITFPKNDPLQVIIGEGSCAGFGWGS